MRPLDWAVLVGTLAAIVGYGVWKTRGIRNVGTYLRGGEDSRWWTIGLSIMATQASAITFLSTPGQGFEDGLGFVQFYFGVPVAMVILSATIVPIYYRTRVYTAYEYLEQRFDLKTRQLTAAIFLLQRGLGAGLSIYAPAIILSTVLGWPLLTTNAVLGVVVIAYTVSGGTRAVNQTQQYQMAVMLGGMALALAFVFRALPDQVSVGDAFGVAGVMGKLKLIDFSPRLETRYTFWSGLAGGTFVALAYFGTDQSQVQRYLSGESLTQSRLGLLFNGLLKVPMQLLILSVGVLVFVFFQFHPPPVFFNQGALAQVRASPLAPELAALERTQAEAFARQQDRLGAWLEARHRGDEAARAEAEGGLRTAQAASRALHDQARALVVKADPRANPKDADYVFLGFVMEHFPSGLVGLLLAVILCAAMSATASALNALATTTLVDFYRRSVKPAVGNDEALRMTRWFTVLWGLVAVGFAVVAGKLDNLIQATNILGSVFYGPMLGVFLVGFFFRSVRGSPVFWATLVAQATVLAVFALSDIGFLWYNVIGCAVVVVLAGAFNRLGAPAPG
jgi:SSS family transporter